MIYDFGYGIHTENLKFRKGAVAKLIRKYGDERFKQEFDEYIEECDEETNKIEAEEAFVSEYKPMEDEGYGEIGCIIRLLNSSPNPEILHGFLYDGEFLYYPARLPDSPLERTKLPTTREIKNTIWRFVNATTVDVTEDFVYDFAGDD